MLADQIKSVLRRRPYWGAESIARELGTTPKIVRVIASKHRITLMNRYEVEKFVDPLVDAVEKLGGPSGG
jgi:hypothetical protein